MSKLPQSETLKSNDPLFQLKLLADPAEQEDIKSDADLLALYVSGGDRGALEILIKRYAPMVASVCRLTVSDPASAEDAFQATFLTLLKSAKKIRRGASVAAWLHGVAYRTACRIRSKKNKQLSNRSTDEVITHADPNDDPIAALARRMELEALDRELERLPERLRQPLIEHYLLGHSAPEIADRMDLSVSAVEGRLRRGRRALRTQLARRGVSLSVVLSGASWFQQHVQAAEAVVWTDQFLETYPTNDPQLDISSDPQISSLVQGEMTMISTSTLKAGIAAAVTLIAGALVAITVSAGDRTPMPTAGANSGITIDAAEMPESSTTVAAQFDGGGLSGGLGGSGGNGGLGTEDVTGFSEMANEAPIDWETPNSEGEGTPNWLAGGAASMTSLEKNRGVLAEQLEFDLVDVTLHEMALWLSEETGTQFEINSTAIEDMGINLDETVTIKGSGSVREMIRRAVASMDLTYVVTESTIEITSEEDAELRLSMRFYDLSYVLPNSSNTMPLVKAIEQTIDPDSWAEVGGNSSISIVGSMMVVSATDTTHQSIEVLLLNISKMNPKNASKAVITNNSQISFGGGGFGGGGFGGGGGMF